MVPQVFRLDISIHALLAEGDEAEFQAAQYALISIHALLAEGDALME